MESFGAYLRHLRETKGISMEEIASQTKINLKYLKAIETDDLGQIPNVVFAKGFIRSYARCLAVNENEVLDRFNQLAASFYHEKAEEIRTDQQVQDEKKESAKRKQAMIQWGVSLVVLMTALGLFILNVSEHREGHLTAGTEESARKSENPERSNEVLPLNPPKEQVEPRTGVSTTAQSANQPRPILSVNPPTASLQVPILSEQRFAAASKEQNSIVSSSASQEKALPELLTLRIEAIERSWVLVKIDTDVTKEVLLNPGEKIDWTAHKQFRLSLGNAGGVRVVFNGKPLEPLGPSGAVVKDLLLPKE